MATSTRADFDLLADAVSGCANFNGEQESRLQELQTVVARLQENWRSARSAGKFDEIWARLRTNTNRMHTSMQAMITSLQEYQSLLSDRTHEHARVLDASDATATHAGAGVAPSRDYTGINSGF
jgi:uncharacterized protein YukE